jgi:CheY-like chemotaxis protein
MAKVRVLVADDNKGIRNMLTSMLAAEFDVIRAFSDGGAALTAVTEMLPDVTILDICDSSKRNRGCATSQRCKDQCRGGFSDRVLRF